MSASTTPNGLPLLIGDQEAPAFVLLYRFPRPLGEPNPEYSVDALNGSMTITRGKLFSGSSVRPLLIGDQFAPPFVVLKRPALLRPAYIVEGFVLSIAMVR